MTNIVQQYRNELSSKRLTIAMKGCVSESCSGVDDNVHQEVVYDGDYDPRESHSAPYGQRFVSDIESLFTEDRTSMSAISDAKLQEWSCNLDRHARISLWCRFSP